MLPVSHPCIVIGTFTGEVVDCFPVGGDLQSRNESSGLQWRQLIYLEVRGVIKRLGLNFGCLCLEIFQIVAVVRAFPNGTICERLTL